MNNYEKIAAIKKTYLNSRPAAQGDRTFEASKQNTWPLKVRRARAYITAHLFDPKLTVSRMKEECFISGHNFSTLFEYYLGMPPKQYMIHHRIMFAQKLLS